MLPKVTCTLLIVDDSPEDRQTFCDMIKRHSGPVEYQVLEASEVREALALCEQVAIDCALVDYRMPDATGLDFLRALFEKHERGQIGVVFVTGMGNEEIAVSAMRQGAVDYVSKTNMRPENLMRALEHARSSVEQARQLKQAEHARLVAQTEQMRSEGDLRRLMESIRDYAIITLDLEGRVVRWGAGARRLLGYHDHEAAGLRFADMLYRDGDSDGDGGAREEMARARSKPVNSDGRWFVRRDGGMFWGTSLLTPIDDELAETCGFALVVHDISAWRDITRSLSGGTTAEDSLRALTERVRAPMTKLVEGLEALRRSAHNNGETHRGDLDTAVRQARELQDVLVQCSKPRAGKLESPPAPEQQVSLAEVLKHYTSIQAPAAKSAVAVRGDALDVRGPWDAHMLLQAFENMFAHAREIDPAVTIEVLPQRDGDQVSVGLTFHGRHPMEEPMFSPYGNEVRDDGPADLRLATARFIIENLGGRVGRRRLRGDGVDLSIYLPLAGSVHA